MFGWFYSKIGKRLLDVSIAAVACIVLLPMLAVTAVLVRCKLGRPILFRQQRPGKGGKPFHLIKFRTMRDDRDSHGNLLSDEQRLTEFGKKLRATSLDELPALANILMGHMSLVGPRPLLMRYLSRYSPRQARRHEVRPGLTGLAQVSGRNLLSWEERFELDIQYVDQLSFWRDVAIIARTFGAVFTRHGIAHEGSVTMPEFMGTSDPQALDGPVYVIGAGGHAKAVIALLERLNYQVEAIFDDSPATHGQYIRGIKVDGCIASLASRPRHRAVVAIGDNASRQRIVSQLDLPWLTLVHPGASVDSTVQLGNGAIVMDGAIIQTDSVIGEHVIVNIAASIAHDCRIADFAHVGPGCSLAGDVQVGSGSLVGIGTSVIPGATIGNRSVVGAGSVVIESVPDDQVAMGSPARCKTPTIKRAA